MPFEIFRALSKDLFENWHDFWTAFKRCRHILKTVKNVTDRPPVHTKTAHFCRQVLKTVDFENGIMSIH